MKKTPTKTTPVPTPPPVPEVEPEVPDWVNETPPEFDYDLMVYDQYEGQLQHIDLTRAEYISVKHHLAGMRGFKVGKQTEGRARY